MPYEERSTFNVSVCNARRGWALSRPGGERRAAVTFAVLAALSRACGGFVRAALVPFCGLPAPTSMPDPLADALATRLLAAFPPHHAYPPEAFDQPPMPPPVAHFLRHWLDERLARETARLALPASPWLRTEHDEVQQAAARLTEVLRRHGCVPAEAWEALLREAAEHVTAYLARPTATLARHVFPNPDEAVPAETLAARASRFAGYDYLYDAVRLYAEQKQAVRIERPAFLHVLREVDRTYTKGFEAADWVKLLEPLFELARAAGLDAVPRPLLLSFFEDKDAEVLVDRLQAGHNGQSRDALDAAGLQRLLEAPAPAPVAAAVEAERPMPAPRPAPAPAAAPASGPVPLWQQFRQNPPVPAARPAATRRPAATPRPQPVAPAEPKPRWMQFRLPADPAPAAPVAPPHAAAPEPAAPTTAGSPDLDAAGSPDLDALEQAVLGETGARHRALFVQHLFGGSPEAYTHVLRRLHETPSWNAASKVIAEDVFKRHQVNIYSEPAILFTDAIEARYA